jgi:predicted acyltransferase
MLWIIGGGSIVTGLSAILEAQPQSSIVGGDSQFGHWIQLLHTQLTHVEWEGFRFYDLIFPLFVFIIGVSTVFSLSGAVQKQGKMMAHIRLLRRFLILYLLGLFYYGGRGDPEQFRYVGVLQRLACCYFAAGLIFLHFRLKGMIVIFCLILGGYWAALTFIPVPGFGAGDLEAGRNLTNYVDQQYLPGYKWDGDWDPEGLLSTIPAIATCLLGIFTGLLLQNENVSKFSKFFFMMVLGVTTTLLGHLWGFEFPIIKKLWTSSYVLLAGGLSILLLALFYFVVDLCRLRFLAAPFIWIGMNPITLYLMANLLDFDALARRMIHQPLLDSFGIYSQLVLSIVSMTFILGIAFFLHTRKIFIKV